MGYLLKVILLHTHRKNNTKNSDINFNKTRNKECDKHQIVKWMKTKKFCVYLSIIDTILLCISWLCIIVYVCDI